MSPPRLGIRWSEPEARKPYARPFGVSFGADAGAVAVNGADLLYYRQFQAAVLALSGELFRHPAVEDAGDPQRAWLDVLGELLPPAGALGITPASEFDSAAGRVFRFAVRVDGTEAGTIEAALLLGYQDLQAVVAHRSGRLYRSPAVENAADGDRTQAAWIAELTRLVARPPEAEAMAATWPWR